MSIQNTNRVYDSKQLLKRHISIKVSEQIRKTCVKKKRRWGFLLKRKLCLCTKCNRYMDLEFGNKQKENNREDAPICIPCIMGKPRREKPVSIKKNWTIVAKRRFKKLKDNYIKNKK